MEKTAIELFAGVGGFRVGLNHVTLGENGKAIEEPNFKFLWANQWEPSTTVQPAFECYKKRFSKGDGSDENEFSNVDISLVNKKDLPNFTLLTGGFPCQDYSVAHSLSKEKGIEGKKGVLWWQINDILKAKKPPFVLLENVDRLLKSPSKQRGRDFGIMLRCFNDNGYTVEWRVINAAEYGGPQRRRRTYIFAYKNNTKHAKETKKYSLEDMLCHNGIFATEFKISGITNKNEGEIDSYIDLIEISDTFQFKFENSGIMRNGKILTAKASSVLETPIALLETLVNEEVDKSFFLTKEQDEKFTYLRGSKKIPRISPDGHEYMYSEGAMPYPDGYNTPGRTMLTSEGTINRSTHVVIDKKTGKYRFLTPIECERLNQFPDNWTNTMTTKKRYFMMGNALVTGIIKRLGKSIEQYIENED